MSTDTLQASPRRRLPISPGTSRNLVYGFAIRSSPGSHKPSAVERLEADKAKYVKSQQVALKKQQPVTCPPNNSQNGLISHPQSRKVLARPIETPQLNLEHLCQLIDGVGDSTVPGDCSSNDQAPAQPFEVHPQVLEETSVALICERPSIETTGCPVMTVRRVDVRPQLPQNQMAGRPQLPNHSQSSPAHPRMPMHLLQLLRPYKPNPQPFDFKRLQNVANPTRGPVKLLNGFEQTSTPSKSPSTPSIPPPTNPEQSSPSPSPLTPSSVSLFLAKNEIQSPPSPAFTRRSSTSTRKRPSLTRSKSDLSDCFSRAGAELERFFNYCGLDPSDLEELARPGSDIVSVSHLRSASAPASEQTAEGEEEEEEEEEASKEEQPVVSVIEKNARVIKWLYGMRQAKESPKVVSM